VASLTSADPRSARDTVATDTPAKSATSCMLDSSFRAAPLYVSVGLWPAEQRPSTGQPHKQHGSGRRPASAVTNCDQDN
jgi:hypothetical protein